jgi:hypothetical protein
MRRFFRKRGVGHEADASQQGYVDMLSNNRISGWVFDPTRPKQPCSVDIIVNEELIACLTASVFRVDLLDLGYGDGRKGFVFDPSSYLRPGENHVRISNSDTGVTVPNGDQVVLHLAGIDSGEHSEADLLELSQVRWKGDEEEARLTWGSMMTGDSFVDVVQRFHAFAGDERVLEIGPGYGRLLRTVLGRSIPFGRYLGLEISAARVGRLMRDFGARGIEFAHGDILKAAPDVQPDLVLCSSTFEHLFPSISTALRNLKATSTPRTQLFIDFIAAEGDDSLRTSHAYFENTTAFVRIYARAELEGLFAEAGFPVMCVERIVLGQDPSGRDVRRALIVAGSD